MFFKLNLDRTFDELMNKNKAIFLDRDGVINREIGRYVMNSDEFEILPTVLQSMNLLSSKGFLLIIITNQGGIAKGLYSHQDLKLIHQKLLDECARYGVKITDIYYSPHHEITGKSLSRKPGSLMLERALSKYNIDPKSSYMIGDSVRDIEAAKKVNIPGVKIESNSPLINIIESLV